VYAVHEKEYARVAEHIREQFEETLAMHNLPGEHGRQVYTTNLTERLVGAHLLERHETWQCECVRYLVIKHLEQAAQQAKRNTKVA
jgi:transposase-like protein